MGVEPYLDALALQGRIARARVEGRIPDVLLLLQHPPVLTKGRRTEARELGMGEDWYRMQGIEVVDTDRGGRLTYHGPGQLVGYPIVDLAGVTPGGQPDVLAFVRALERMMIASLAAHDVPAQVFEGLTGVWTAGVPPIPVGAIGPQGTPVAACSPELSADTGEARKIGSIGLHVSRGVTTHGIAINVNNDLQPFDWIVPCGIEAARMTSVAREHGAEQDFDAFADAVAEQFAEVLGREAREVEAGALRRRLEPIEA
jgi:lipoyl(octanoyl) transferase